jgi:hypothetical protein
MPEATQQQHRAAAAGSLGIRFLAFMGSMAMLAAASPVLAQAAPAGWGLILGADSSLPAAQQEAANAAKLLGRETSIYRCGNWYRTIIVFRDKQQCLQGLTKAQLHSPYNPYLVDMSSWCPTKARVK